MQNTIIMLSLPDLWDLNQGGRVYKFINRLPWRASRQLYPAKCFLGKPNNASIDNIIVSVSCYGYNNNNLEFALYC